jgi:hypothetical protein
MYGLGILVAGVALVLSPAARAQAPKPGPEHEKLKELVGTWDATMNFMGSESKATAVYRMDLGGLWLVSEFKGDFGGMPFSGKGLDSYDPLTKKYVSVWADSMSTVPMTSTGEYDKTGKVLTMTGEGRGQDGKMQKMKMTSEMKDKDSMLFTMYGPGPDGKDGVMFTINYKRKK